MISSIVEAGKAVWQGIKAAMVTKDIIIDVNDNPDERIESFSQGEGLGAFVSMPDDPEEVKSLIQDETLVSKVLSKVSSVFLNKFTKPLINFLSSPTVVRIATLASAGILAGGVFIGGSIATGGILPILTLVTAGTSVAAIAAGVVMDARRVQETHYVRAESQAVTGINLYIKLIEQRIESIKAINPEIAEYLRDSSGLLIKRQEGQEPSSKPKVIRSILRTLQNKAPEGTSAFLTSLTAIPSGPIGIATATISGIGMLVGYERNSRIQYAIDRQSKQIKNMTDKTLMSIGLDVSKFHGKERVLMVLEVRNLLLAEDRALSAISQALKDGKITTKEEIYTILAQEKHKEYQSIIKEEHKVIGPNIPTFRKCIGEVLTEGLSSSGAAAMFVPKCNIINTDITASRENQRQSHLKHVEKVTELYKEHNPLLNKLRSGSEPSLATLGLDEEGSCVKPVLRRVASEPALATNAGGMNREGVSKDTELHTTTDAPLTQKNTDIARYDKAENAAATEHKKYVNIVQEEGRIHRAIGR